jgi:hypothetical protein
MMALAGGAICLRHLSYFPSLSSDAVVPLCLSVTSSAAAEEFSLSWKIKQDCHMSDFRKLYYSMCPIIPKKIHSFRSAIGPMQHKHVSLANLSMKELFRSWKTISDPGRKLRISQFFEANKKKERRREKCGCNVNTIKKRANCLRNTEFFSACQFQFSDPKFSNVYASSS